jgi:hypothetical protein
LVFDFWQPSDGYAKRPRWQNYLRARLPRAWRQRVCQKIKRQPKRAAAYTRKGHVRGCTADKSATTHAKARQELESKTGRKVVSGENYLPPVTRKKLSKS